MKRRMTELVNLYLESEKYSSKISDFPFSGTDHSVFQLNSDVLSRAAYISV